MKICIVKLSAMGDIIHAMVVLQFIKKQIPDCQIDWIVEDSFRDILENNPNIDNILPVNLKSIKKNIFNIFRQKDILNNYAKNKYHIVIDAQGLIKSALVSKIIGNKLVGSKIIGFDKESIREKYASWLYTDTVNIGYEKNVIDRNIKVMCESIGVQVQKEDILNKEPFLYFYNCDFSNLLSDEKKNILFVVGASRQNKIYPKEKFLELSLKLDENIIVVWANDEEKNTAEFLKQNNKEIKVSEKLSIDNLKCLISKCDLVIGADTGPTHMAWALNTASITIFGNTPENRNTYITPINKVVKSKSDVNPLKLDYNDFTIRDIEAVEILKLSKEILQ